MEKERARNATTSMKSTGMKMFQFLLETVERFLAS